MTFTPRTQEELALTFPPELEHVSASSLAMAIRCEEQWRQRYMLGKRQAPALAPMLGQADHKAIGYGMQVKMDTEDLPPVAEIRDLFLAELEGRVEEYGLKEIEVDKAETLPQKKKVYDQSRVQGQELVAMYHTKVSPVLTPISVEQRFDIELPGLPVVMNGYIDLQVAVQDDPVVIDRKRVTRRSSEPKPDWSLQAEIYQLVTQAPFAWHLSVVKKEPELVVDEPGLFKAAPPYERSLRFVQQIVRKLGFLYQVYGPDEPWPTTGKLHPWACNYCGYRPDCWGWQE